MMKSSCWHGLICILLVVIFVFSITSVVLNFSFVLTPFESAVPALSKSEFPFTGNNIFKLIKVSYQLIQSTNQPNLFKFISDMLKFVFFFLNAKVQKFQENKVWHKVILCVWFITSINLESHGVMMRLIVESL